MCCHRMAEMYRPVPSELTRTLTLVKALDEAPPFGMEVMPHSAPVALGWHLSGAIERVMSIAVAARQLMNNPTKNNTQTTAFRIAGMANLLLEVELWSHLWTRDDCESGGLDRGACNMRTPSQTRMSHASRRSNRLRSASTPADSDLSSASRGKIQSLSSVFGKGFARRMHKTATTGLLYECAIRCRLGPG